MTRRSRLALLAAVLCGCLLAPAVAWAVFATQSQSSASAGADTVTNWVGAYSQGTDPFNLTGYLARQGCSGQPAASGQGLALSVNLGGVGKTSQREYDMAFTLITPRSFPEAQSIITVTASASPDPATGLQPLQAEEMNLLHNDGGVSSYSFVPGNVIGQMNLVVDTSHGFPANRQYVPVLHVTVTFSGENSGFLRYDIPVKVYTGSGCGPN
jgi:hypothetical protein